MKELLAGVIEEIKPNKEYQKDILEGIGIIVKKINKNIKDAKVVLGGSGAKGTWLKTFDADIFVKFNYGKYKGRSGELSDILYRTLKRIFPRVRRLHGSRDYFQIKQDKFTFEIIPILDVKKAGQAQNITDVSPLHSRFVSKYKKLADEIRLTKQFCKASDVYGAESYIRGFSGYICEILTIYYGSFLSLVKNASKWKGKVVIDVKGYYKGKDVFREINKSKLVSPLIVIDPVQKDRNAAAALSGEKFEMFREKAREFLKRPSERFFEIKKFDIDDLKEKYKDKKLILLEAWPLKKKQDIAGAKLLKAFEFLSKELSKNNFKIMESGWHWDKKARAYFYFVFKDILLPETDEITGPPIRVKFHFEKFRKKYKKTIVRKKRIFAVVKRKFRKPEDFFKSLIKNSYIKDKVKKINILK